MSVPRLELATVRGLACIALVAYHVVGPTHVSGMHLPDSSYWHFAMNGFDFLRMPMFTALSGFIYAGRRADVQSLSRFYFRKAGRLGAPLLFVTAVVFALRQQVYHDDLTFGRAIFFHYEHLWYLQALILIFFAVAAWDAFRRPAWVELCVAGLAAVMISRTFATTTFFSINGALYLSPFFLMGMVLRIEQNLLASRDLSKLAAATVVIVILTQQASLALGGNELNRFTLPAALCGICGAYLLLAHCPRIRPIEVIGRYSYTIFLWHSVAASGARHALAAMVTMPVLVEFEILLAAGLFAPIVLHLIVVRIPILSLLAAGVQTSTARTKPAEVLRRRRRPLRRSGHSLALTVRVQTGFLGASVHRREVLNEPALRQKEVA